MRHCSIKPLWLIPATAMTSAIAPGPAAASENQARNNAVTAYVGKISSVPAWHDLFTDPLHVTFVDAYVAVAAYSRDVHGYFDERLRLEVEGNVAYNFGLQDHWEFNLAVVPRWTRFPWNNRIETSLAFGLGLSMASELPSVEVQLESQTQELLIFWMLELTLGPPNSRWAASIRLHHRSGAFGLLAEDGGMNAPSIGIRYRF